MICLQCREVRPGEPVRCPTCGESLVPMTPENVERLVALRVKGGAEELVNRWRDGGVLDEASVQRIRSRLPRDLAQLEARRPVPRKRREPRPRPVEVPAPVMSAPMEAVAIVAAVAVEPVVAQAVEAHAYDAQHAGSTAENLFGGGQASQVATEGVEVFAALDSPELAGPSVRSEVWPILYENIGWFVGALFVLAGSVYGVREAWRSLGDVARLLVIAGAFFAYHGAFTGLAALLASRSDRAGRALAGIATGLVAIAFVSLSSLVAIHPVTGLAASAVGLGLAWFTLGSIAKRYDIVPASALRVVLGATLGAEVAVGFGEPGGLVRALVPAVGVGAVAWAVRGAVVQAGVLPLRLLAAAGAAVVEIFAAAGMPGEASVDGFASGSVGFAFLSLRAVVYAWVASMAARDELEKRSKASWPPVLDVAALGVAAIAVAGSFLAAMGNVGPVAAIAHAATAVIAAIAFSSARRTHAAAGHFVVPAASVATLLLVSAVVPGPGAWRWFGALLAPAAIAAGLIDAELMRDRLIRRWALWLMALATLLACGFPRDDRWGAVAAGVIAAAAYFKAGGAGPNVLRYLSGLAGLAAAASWLLVGAATAYAGLGVVLEPDTDGRPRAFDDLSLLVLGVAAVLVGIDGTDVLGLSVCGAGLLLRSLRDRSRIVSAAGAYLVLQATGVVVLRGGWIPLGALAGALSIVAVLIAVLRGSGREVLPARGVAVFGTLPWGGTPRVTLFDGFAVAAAVLFAQVAFGVWTWLSVRPEDARMAVVLGAALAAVAAFAGWVTPGLEAFRARGKVTPLWILAAFAAMAGVTNRVGRPLPPDVVGVKLTMIATGLWLVALALRRWGPAIAEKLDSEKSGRWYHTVPHTGVVVLAIVLVADAVLVALPWPDRTLAIVPPSLILGPVLLCVLLAGSLRSLSPYAAMAPLGVAAGALIGAQRAVFGPSLELLDPASGIWTRVGSAEWLPAGVGSAQLQARALVGVASWAGVAALVVMGLTWLPESIRERISQFSSGSEAARARRAWAGAIGVAAVALAIGEAWIPALDAAAILLVAGLFAVGSGQGGAGVLGLSIGVLAAVHALAHAFPFVPWWIGPAAAAGCAAFVGVTPSVLGEHARTDSPRFARARVLAIVLAVEALIYALATGGATSRTDAGAVTIADAAIGLAGLWVTTPAVAVTLGLLASAAGLVGAQAQVLGDRDSGVRGGFGGALLGGLGVLAAVTFLGSATVADPFPMRLVPALALAGAIWGLVSHGAARFLRTTEAEGALEGVRVARDGWLVAGGLATAWFAARGGERAGAPLAIAALVVIALVSVHAAWRERTSWHVYFVQVAAVGIYGVVRNVLAPDLPPQADAIFALVLGFVLLGVTVIARRLKIAPVANATRRFAALAPLAVGAVLPFEPTIDGALYAAGSAALWGALGWVERSRLLGSLGAGAMNLALAALAMSTGARGVEVYLAPLGLFVLALGQIFQATTTVQSRLVIRVVGSLLLYLPSALQIALQVGNAQDAAYPIWFGLACLAGIGLGMLLHIRAYLALGVGFLVLDVVASLVYAGLRDNRVGFVVLSLTGLGVLSFMVWMNLRRAQFEAIRAALRARLRTWE